MLFKFSINSRYDDKQNRSYDEDRFPQPQSQREYDAARNFDSRNQRSRPESYDRESQRDTFARPESRYGVQDSNYHEGSCLDFLFAMTISHYSHISESFI